MVSPKYIFALIAALVIVFAGVNMSLQSFNQDFGSNPAIKVFAVQKESEDSWQINLLGVKQEIDGEQLDSLIQYAEMIRAECQSALAKAKTWLQNNTKSVNTNG